MKSYLFPFLIGYLLGSVSISILLSKLVLRDDVRAHGSGNAGATNVARVYGMRAGLLTLGGDILKTLLSGFFGWLLGGQTGLIIAFTGCFLGHCWPVYFGFHGGKGVAVAVAVTPFIDLRVFLILFVLFFLVFALSRRVSLGSVACALALPIAYWLLNPGLSLKFRFCVFVCVLLVFQHKENLVRLLHGQEPEFRPRSAKE